MKAHSNCAGGNAGLYNHDIGLDKACQDDVSNDRWVFYTFL